MYGPNGMRPPGAMGMGRPHGAPMMGGQGPQPNGNAFGQRFQQQFGMPPGQAEDGQFQAFKQGLMGQMGGQGGGMGGPPQSFPGQANGGQFPGQANGGVFPGQANGGVFPGGGMNQGQPGQGMGGAGLMNHIGRMGGQMPPWLMQMLQQRFGQGGGGFGGMG